MPRAYEPGQPGLFLQVEIEPETVRVSHAERVPRTSRTELRAPLLTDKAGRELAGSSELVLATLDKRGVREQFAWSTRSIAFMDREDDSEAGALRGTPRDSKINTRVLRIPVPDDVEFLLFYESALVPYGEPGAAGPIARRPLALYFTGLPGVPIPPIPPLPFPDLRPPVPLRLPFRPPRLLMRPHRPVRVTSHLAGSNTLVYSGPPAQCFDIVILGDGFASSELAVFDARADAIANGLIVMPPFDALAGKINIHTVRAVSLDSGITDCPVPAVSKSTYFDVRGNFNGLYPGFVGTAMPERVYQAAEVIAPREQLEVFLVIANCAIEGGSAFPPQRLAFVTMYADMTKFVNIAAHELGHVIGGACEEYIGCAENDPMHPYPNQATDAERTANTIAWKPLALAAELDGTGNFRAQHVLGDPFDSNNQPIVAPELKGMLGAYWGAQDIAIGTGSQPGCDPYQDARGAGFFRPMAECRMRKSFFKFCRVCSERMTEVITAYGP
jgi:IgA peptidase M64